MTSPGPFHSVNCSTALLFLTGTYNSKIYFVDFLKYKFETCPNIYQY